MTETTSTDPRVAAIEERLGRRVAEARSGIEAAGIDPRNIGRIDGWLRESGFVPDDGGEPSVEIDPSGRLCGWDWHPDDTDGTNEVQVWEAR